MSVIDFTMPSLGADMDAGTITEWMVAVGDSVNRGDIVAIVETDKADIDIEVWNSGVVTEIVIPTGELVAVGTPLARIELLDDEKGPDHPTRGDDEPSTAETASTSAYADQSSENAKSNDAVPGDAVSVDGTARSAALDPRSMSARGVLASPLVRRLAVERRIDLSGIRGSGPGGAIIARDLNAVRPQPSRGTKPTSGPETSSPTDPADRMRRAIAELMTRSKREIPHYYLETEIDLEAATGWLQTINAERSVGERILPAAMILKAAATALAKHPEFNGFWTEDGFVAGHGIHLGVAVSLRGGGLVAPAIRHADGLTVAELMASLRDLVGRSRSGRLRASEMTDPTVTITNLGDRGVDVVNGVIYPPQVALIGVGRIAVRPAAIDGVIVARQRVTLTLAADHRASDGQRGARLLNTVARLLQEPEEL